MEAMSVVRADRPLPRPGRRVELTSYQDVHDAGRRIAALAGRLPVPVGQVSRRSVVLPYRRGMAAKERPTPEDTAAARKILLGGLARDAEIFDLMRRACAAASAGQHLPRRGVPSPRRRRAGLVRRQPSRPDWPWRTTRAVPARVRLPRPTNRKLQHAVLAAAALHGGTEPDLLDEVAWWQTDDFWQYALFAAVAYVRAAASRAGTPVRQACQYLAEHQDRPGP